MGAALLRKRSEMSPVRILALGFFAVILVGTLLLLLPVSSASGEGVGFIAALFTATSCTCVTGLSVVEAGLVFSGFGHVVMLVLIQLGGLGFMTAAAFLFSLVGKRMSLNNRLTIAEGLNESGMEGLSRLVRRVLALTGIVELSGAALLAVRLVPLYGVGRGLWYSLFHSVSAFCNAGFDILGNGDSIGVFANDPYMLAVIAAVLILGGTGFAVIYETVEKRRWHRLSTHTKAVLCATGVLLAAGTVLFLAAEWNNPATIGNMPVGDKLMNAFFQSATLRTAGFASLQQGALRNASLILCLVLMFIGASPASAGGGVKTTTIFVLILQVVAVVKGRSDLEFSGRRLPEGIGRRAVAIICITLAIVLTLAFGISIAESSTDISSMEILYETVSAMATVGNSMGITARLSPVSQVLLVVGMFCGRVGPLTLALAFSGRQLKRKSHYPEGRIMIG